MILAIIFDNIVNLKSTINSTYPFLFKKRFIFKDFTYLMRCKKKH